MSREKEKASGDQKYLLVAGLVSNYVDDVLVRLRRWLITAT
jgi:hypothetical protein